MIEILTENLAAGELKTFMLQGAYIEILDAAYPVDVFLMDRNGGQISTMRKAEASFFSRPGQFECVQLQSATAQTVRFFVGSGDAGTRRSAGIVQVVDGGLARTIANAAFSSGTGLQTSVAANTAGLQLWNKAAAGGLSLVVEQITMMSNYNGAINFAISKTQAQMPGLFGAAVSKLGGGAASAVAELRTQENAANGSVLGYLGAPSAFSVATYVPKEPIVVPPGWGLNLIDGQGGAVATHATWATFEHYERA